MNRILTILGLLLVLSTQQIIAQCNFSVNTAEFEYTVDIDISVTDVISIQQGTSCNVQLELTYDIDINVITSPPWWNGDLYALQGNVDCIGASGASFFNLPNGGGTGTVTSATFTFASTDCVDAFFDCPILIEIKGPELDFNGEPCGAFNGLSPLPLVLSDFSYTKKESGGFDLFWLTEAEIDFSHFELELTKDFARWENVATILGENNRFGAAYHYNVSALEQGNYIRLKMLDRDGSFEYSDALYLPYASTQEVSVYPNPATNILFLHGIKNQEVMIYNALGQLVVVPSYDDQSLDISRLEPGPYVLHNRQHISGQKIIRFVKM